MAVVVHGEPGRSVLDAQVGDRDSARRGSWWECQVGAALEKWLDARPETFHLFHDLVGFDDVRGEGFGSMSLGGMNIDHVMLMRTGWIMFDAKGCAAGFLRVHEGRGQVRKSDGTEVPQPWLDDLKSQSLAAVLTRLIGGRSRQSVFVVPTGVRWEPSLVEHARAFSKGGVLADMASVNNSDLDALLPPGQAEAEDVDVERLCRYLYTPDS